MKKLFTVNSIYPIIPLVESNKKFIRRLPMFTKSISISRGLLKSVWTRNMSNEVGKVAVVGLGLMGIFFNDIKPFFIRNIGRTWYCTSFCSSWI